MACGIARRQVRVQRVDGLVEDVGLSRTKLDTARLEAGKMSRNYSLLVSTEYTNHSFTCYKPSSQLVSRVTDTEDVAQTNSRQGWQIIVACCLTKRQ